METAVEIAAMGAIAALLIAELRYVGNTVIERLFSIEENLIELRQSLLNLEQSATNQEETERR